MHTNMSNQNIQINAWNNGMGHKSSGKSSIGGDHHIRTPNLITSKDCAQLTSFVIWNATFSSKVLRMNT